MGPRRTARALALGVMLLALGCRTAPRGPAITTPLYPDAVVAGPGTTPGVVVTPPIVIPPGAQLPAPGTLSGSMPKAMPKHGPVLPPANTPANLDLAMPSKTQPVGGTGPDTLPPPEIKPLLVDAPRPPAGPDGFAPAPVIPPPELPKAMPATRIENNPATPSPLKPGERFGRAPDYRWIAGVLDRHAKGGYWTLRYADFASDDEWGGKVRLVDDPRLDEFHDGDVVYIEGALLAPRSAANSEGLNYPPYRINNVRRIEIAR